MEELQKLEELISLLYQDRLTQYGKRLLVENIVKLQKENEELKDFKKQVTEIESTNFIKYKNYISKQEVKDKIEEINKKILNATKYDEKISVYRYQKQILQELIEESE